MICVSHLLAWVVVLVLVLSRCAQAQQTLPSLIPEWPDKGSPGPVTTTEASPTVCAAILDVQTNGNPNCAQDQQFFDTQSCRFVCNTAQALPQQSGVGETRQKNTSP